MYSSTSYHNLPFPPLGPQSDCFHLKLHLRLCLLVSSVKDIKSISSLTLTSLPLQATLCLSVLWSIFIALSFCIFKISLSLGRFLSGYKHPICHLKMKQSITLYLTLPLIPNMVLYFFITSQLGFLMDRERKIIIYTCYLYDY